MQQPQRRGDQRLAESFSDSCCQVLDCVNLQDVFQRRFIVLRNCPHHVRGRFRQAARQALELRSHAVRVQDHIGEARGWKLFCFLSVLFLRRGQGGSNVTKEELCHRFDLFAEGESRTLFREVMIAVDAQNFRPPSRTDSAEQRVRTACRKGAPESASPGPGGCTYEHLRVLLDESGILELFFEAVSSLAQATVPQEVAEVLTG